MAYTDKDLFLKWWGDAWDAGLWAAAWSKSVEGLAPEQAAWQPAGRDTAPHHSIWQIVEHMIFWRENGLGRLDGGPRPTETELKSSNFPQPGDVSDARGPTPAGACKNRTTRSPRPSATATTLPRR